jgi:hypothetical protein
LLDLDFNFEYPFYFDVKAFFTGINRSDIDFCHFIEKEDKTITVSEKDKRSP